MSSEGQAFTITAADGFALGATLFEPDEPARSTVVVLGATAVAQSYYRDMATYLMARGRRVITFDYRGIGTSRPSKLRGFRAQMLDWVDQDIRAVLGRVRDAWPDTAIDVLGHSFGGQALGLLGDEGIQRAVLVATQMGDMHLFPVALRRRLQLARYLVEPLSAATLGYFPSQWVRLGEDMPSGVMRQWVRWCLTRDYFFGDPSVMAEQRFAACRTAIHMLLIADDHEFAPIAASKALAARFTAAKVTFADITPDMIGAPIGHFGFFRRSRCGALWDQVDAALSS